MTFSHDHRFDSVIGKYEDGGGWWASYFTDRITGTDGVIDVNIAEGTMGHYEIDYINEVIDNVESIIDTEIRIGTSKRDSDITIARVLGYERFDVLTGVNYSGYQGLAFVNGDHVMATFNDSKFTTDEHGVTVLSDETKYVIAHEFLHALGLQHPDGNGFNTAFTTDDTLMSYNKTGNFQLTNLDATALSHLW